jgi:beta-carotene ketolase (CrtW type)
MSAASSEPRITPNQTLIGLSLALMIMTAWLAVHVYGVYWHRWTAWSLLIAPVLIALQTWLSVGLFIVAHDAMDRWPRGVRASMRRQGRWRWRSTPDFASDV